MRRRLGWVLAWDLFGLLAVSSAQAEDQSTKPPLVVLVRMQACCAAFAWPAAEAAAKLELESLGLRVEVAEGQATEERARRLELSTLAKQKNAVCAVRIVRPEDAEQAGFEIWIEDRLTGKTLFRKLPLSNGQGRDKAGLAALRISEALRASLIEVRLPQAQASLKEPAKEIEALLGVSASADQKAAPTPERLEAGPWGVGLLGGALYSPGGVAPSASLCLGASFRGVSDLAVLGEALVTVYGTGVEARGIHSTLNVAALRAMAAWDSVRLRPFHILLGSGVGLFVPWSTGFGPSTIAPTTDFIVAAWLGATVRLGWDVGRWTTLWLGYEVGTLLPKVEITYGDAVVATFAQLLMQATFGVELRLP